MAPIKEPNFFSQADMRPELYAPQYRRSVSFNLSRYLSGPMHHKMHIADVRTWDEYYLLFKNVRHERVIGEGSNSYLFCPSAPKHIAARFPCAKILMILRNPVERAWSHYMMNRKLGYPVKDNFLGEFHNDTQKEPQGWGITANYFRLGLYAEQLQRFLKVFPRNQIKVITYDDFQREPRETLVETFEFLQVDPHHELYIETQTNAAALPRWPTLHFVFQSSLASIIKHRLSTPIKNVMEKVILTRSNLPKLSQSERQSLINDYEPDIRQLATMLDRNLDHWLN